MSKIDLHIISFDIPLPADYGGVIDVFYKLKSLSELGLGIHLHCFYSQRSGKPELEYYTKEVSYYERNQNLLAAIGTKPYIIQSRSSKKLLENLLKDSAPILFEGIHSCAFLEHPVLKDRLKLVRTHNIEHEYYDGLRLSEKSLLKRQYYYTESKRLASTENILKAADFLLAISPTDVEYFKAKNYKVQYLPVFHPYQPVYTARHERQYILYHGNLSVPMNEEAVRYIIEKVLPRVNANLVVAGKEPTVRLRSYIASKIKVELLHNPSHHSLQSLINQAQVNVLPAFESCGIKLKLLAALFFGGHCLASPQMVNGSGLKGLCEIAMDEDEWVGKINKMLGEDFSDVAKEKRMKVLNERFDNRKNAQMIIDLLSAQK